MRQEDFKYVVAQKYEYDKPLYSGDYAYCKEYDILYGATWTPYCKSALTLTLEMAQDLLKKFRELDRGFRKFEVRMLSENSGSIFNTLEVEEKK